MKEESIFPLRKSRLISFSPFLPLLVFGPIPSVSEGINPFPKKPWFLRVCSTSLLKTVREKEKLLVMSNFSFFPQCFLAFWRAICHFRQIKNCGLQTILSLEESKICLLGKG